MEATGLHWPRADEKEFPSFSIKILQTFCTAPPSGNSRLCIFSRKPLKSFRKLFEVLAREKKKRKQSRSLYRKLSICYSSLHSLCCGWTPPCFCNISINLAAAARLNRQRFLNAGAGQHQQASNPADASERPDCTWLYSSTQLFQEQSTAPLATLCACVCLEVDNQPF